MRRVRGAAAARTAAGQSAAAGARPAAPGGCTQRTARMGGASSQHKIDGQVLVASAGSSPACYTANRTVPANRNRGTHDPPRYHSRTLVLLSIGETMV